MACQTSAGVAAYENCGVNLVAGYGLQPYNSNDPNAAAIKAAVQSSMPSGAPSDYPIAAEACLRAGGILYWRADGSSCLFPSMNTSVSSGQIVGLSGSASSGVIGGLGAAGIIGGAATLGITAAISVAVAGIETIIAHHAAAVANENNTICTVAGYFNGAKQKIDAAARSGQISSDQAYAFLNQVSNQAQAGLASIEQKCNAACVYIGILTAFQNYARTWYDSIVPPIPTAQAPAGPPTFYGTPPGGVTAAPGSPPPPPPIRSIMGNTYLPAGPSTIQGQIPANPLTSNQNVPGNPNANDFLNLGYNQPTGQATQGADIPSTWVLPSWLLPVAAIVVIVLLIRSQS